MRLVKQTINSRHVRRVIAIAGTFLLAACMSPHQKRIHDARSGGNEGRAYCYESCDAKDKECIANCKTEFPDKWHHRFTKAAKPFLVAGKKVEASVAVALHPMAVNRARNDGNEPLAACYDACSPTKSSCMRACDKSHASEEDEQRRREMYLTVLKIGLEAYKIDQARATDKANQASTSTGSAGSSQTGGGQSGNSGRPCTIPKSTMGKVCESNDDCHNGTICIDDGTQTRKKGDVTVTVGTCQGTEVLKCE